MHPLTTLPGGGFGAPQPALAMHKSLCAMPPPGPRAGAQEEQMRALFPAWRLLSAWPFVDSYNSFCSCSGLAQSHAVSQQS